MFRLIGDSGFRPRVRSGSVIRWRVPVQLFLLGSTVLTCSGLSSRLLLFFLTDRAYHGVGSACLVALTLAGWGGDR